MLATPLIESPRLAADLGAHRVIVAAVHMQPTGSFKFWGTRQRLLQLSPGERERGVVAFSSGNFAQALAAAGSATGTPVTIVMPDDAPPEKLAGAEAHGAEVIRSSDSGAGREVAAAEVARRTAQERNLTLLHPFDDAQLVAGHTQLCAAMLAELARNDIEPGVFICPVGGGGLVAGLADALNHAGSDAELVAVEPVGFDGLGRSLAAGHIVQAPGGVPTLCDGMMARAPGNVPFEILSARSARSAVLSRTTTDDQVRNAMRFAFSELKLVLEPSGAAGLAAFLSGELEVRNRIITILTTGGNVSLERFAALTRTE